MYIQENAASEERSVPPDYSGHTYTAPPAPTAEVPVQEELPPMESDGEQTQKSAPAGAFSGEGRTPFSQKGGKRGDFFGNLGLSGLFSRVPFLSSLAPPPRRCGEEERKHSELWDWVLLAVVALSLLNGRDDDILPLLLLLLLWD